MTEETGLPTSFSAHFGLDLLTERKSRAMSSTALERCMVAVTFALACGVAQAKDAPPRMLQEPLFGLRLAAANVKLDVLPDDLRKQCFEIADNAYLTGRQWVYAMVRDGGATYYVVSGYFERRHPDPGEPRYRVDTVGGVYRIEKGGCLGIGAVRDVFQVRPLKETPQPILEQLAADSAVRLARAFGGPDRLRMKLRNAHVDRNSLGPELRAAFDPYWKK